jgi:omega-6 fatty acid desaturase (delta-12 desaturase)
MACSVLTFTPYDNWRRQHNGHHGNWNNLDRRESGADIYSACLTIDEYRRLDRWGRIRYRLTRNPVIAHILIPPIVFLLLYRVPFDTPRDWPRERLSVLWTNLGIATLLGGLTMIFGIRSVLLIQLPVVALTSIVGVWLFSLQHRFEGVGWMRREDWTPVRAALEGSSYLELPRPLQWFTGNIGFHHVHHLSPRVPNYRLEACHDAVPALRSATRISWRQGLKSIGLVLWDENRAEMVGFAEARRRV